MAGEDHGRRRTQPRPTLAREALKIVAGLEPETNAFLQMLAEAATKGDGVEAARRVNAGEPPPADPGPGGAEPSVASRNAPPNSAPSLGTSTSAPPAAPPVAPPAVDLNAPPEPDSPVAAARARAPARPQSARRAPPKVTPSRGGPEVVEDHAAIGGGGGRALFFRPPPPRGPPRGRIPPL